MYLSCILITINSYHTYQCLIVFISGRLIGLIFSFDNNLAKLLFLSNSLASSFVNSSFSSVYVIFFSFFSNNHIN